MQFSSISLKEIKYQYKCSCYILFLGADYKDPQTVNKEDCTLVEEDLSEKETCLSQSENCVKEETNLPVMVELVSGSDESNVEEISNESQPENAYAVALGENHVEEVGDDAEEKIQEEEIETIKVESCIYNMEDVD